MRILLAIFIILGTVSCSTTNSDWIHGDELAYIEFRDSEVPPALDRFETLWAENNYKHYTYEIRLNGVFGGSIYRINVSPDGCSAKYVRHIGLRTKFGCERATMPQLFSDLRKALPDENELVANFDPQTGALVSFYVEPRTNFTDQGWGMNIEHLAVRAF